MLALLKHVMRTISLLSILSLLTTALVSVSPVFAQDGEVCPNTSVEARVRVMNQLGSYDLEYAKNARPRFFVGLWTKLEASEKPAFGQIMRADDAQMSGLRETMRILSGRLAQDREHLSAWVRANGLESEIEVESIPADGSFLFFKASRLGMSRVLCASLSGELPSYMFRMGH